MRRRYRPAPPFAKGSTRGSTATSGLVEQLLCVRPGQDEREQANGDRGQIECVERADQVELAPDVEARSSKNQGAYHATYPKLRSAPARRNEQTDRSPQSVFPIGIYRLWNFYSIISFSYMAARWSLISADGSVDVSCGHIHEAGRIWLFTGCYLFNA